MIYWERFHKEQYCRCSGFVAVEIFFTPQAKRVLKLSLEEASQLGHNYIETEHLLMGLVREGEGVAARVVSIVYGS